MSALRELTYLLPIRRASAADDDDLAPYLRRLAGLLGEVIVVDGSPPGVFALHAAAFGPEVRHVAVDPAQLGANGKVAGVRTGMALASHETVIVADDDVRYGIDELHAVHEALAAADVVRPQNYFDPLPWHALLDEGRSLIARATGGDWPGTLGVRRSAYRRAGGYDADVLFENLELVRTIRAAGGTERVLDAVFVARRPPRTAHYLGQRVRQAYDEFARPARFALQLALAPAAAAVALRTGSAGVAALCGAAIALAECGRRRGGATRRFPLAASVLAPVWVAERAVTSWLALAVAVRGGVRYAGRRVRVAATSERTLRARLEARA